MSGAWAAMTQRLGLPTGAPTHDLTCGATSSWHDSLRAICSHGGSELQMWGVRPATRTLPFVLYCVKLCSSTSSLPCELKFKSTQTPAGGRNTDRSLHGRNVKELASRFGNHHSWVSNWLWNCSIFLRMLPVFLVGPDDSVQLFALIKFLKFPSELVAPTFMLPWLTITFG